MSYDLYLFHPRPGVDPKQVVEELLSTDEGLVLRRMLASKNPGAQRQTEVATRGAGTRAVVEKDPAQAENLRLAQALGALSPRLKIAARPEAGAGRILVTQPGNGIQLALEREHVAVTLPYSHPEHEASAVFEELARYVAALEKEGGFQTYDPQIGRVVRLPAEVDALVTTYRRSADTAMNPTAPKPKPWWKVWK